MQPSPTRSTVPRSSVTSFNRAAYRQIGVERRDHADPRARDRGYGTAGPFDPAGLG